MDGGLVSCGCCCVSAVAAGTAAFSAERSTCHGHAAARCRAGAALGSECATHMAAPATAASAVCPSACAWHQWQSGWQEHRSSSAAAHMAPKSSCTARVVAAGCCRCAAGRGAQGGVCAGPCACALAAAGGPCMRAATGSAPLPCTCSLTAGSAAAAGQRWRKRPVPCAPRRSSTCSVSACTAQRWRATTCCAAASSAAADAADAAAAQLCWPYRSALVARC